MEHSATDIIYIYMYVIRFGPFLAGSSQYPNMALMWFWTNRKWSANDQLLIPIPMLRIQSWLPPEREGLSLTFDPTQVSSSHWLCVVVTWFSGCERESEFEWVAGVVREVLSHLLPVCCSQSLTLSLPFLPSAKPLHHMYVRTSLPPPVTCLQLAVYASVVSWEMEEGGGEFTSHCLHLASFPGSPSPFLTFFAREYYTRKIEGEGEPGTEPRPPVATLASHDHDHGGHALHCAQCRSRAALWIVATSLRSHKDS